MKFYDLGDQSFETDFSNFGCALHNFNQFHGSRRWLWSSSHSKRKRNSEKLSKSGLRRCTNFAQAHSNNEQKKDAFVDFIFYIGFPELIWGRHQPKTQIWPVLFNTF